MAIVAVGSVALDTLKTPKASVTRALGGSAFHFAHAASLLENVKLVGVVGYDYPEEGIAFLKARGVDLEGLEIKKDEKTFFWEGYYEDDMAVAHTTVTELNAFERFRPVIPESYTKEPYLFLANIDPSLQHAALDAMKNAKLVMMDTMNFWIHGKKEAVREVVRRAHIALLNDQEIKDLTGEIFLYRGAEALLADSSVLRYVIVKKGENGAVVVGRDDIFSVPAYPVKTVVDPTGAGDSFAGGVMSYLAYAGELTKQTLSRAMVYATAIASFYVQGIGAEGFKNITINDVRARVSELRAMTEFGEVPLDA